MSDKFPKITGFQDVEEQALFQDIESGGYDFDNPLGAKAIERLEMLATNTANPVRKQITTRLPERDLSRLRAIAMEKGIPYQTLIASIIHQYVEGTLRES